MIHPLSFRQSEQLTNLACISQPSSRAHKIIRIRKENAIGQITKHLKGIETKITIMESLHWILQCPDIAPSTIIHHQSITKTTNSTTLISSHALKSSVIANDTRMNLNNPFTIKTLCSKTNIAVSRKIRRECAKRKDRTRVAQAAKNFGTFGQDRQKTPGAIRTNPPTYLTHHIPPSLHAQNSQEKKDRDI